MRAPVKVRSKAREAFELSRYMRPNMDANAPTVRSGLRTLTWLLLRALPLKELATVVDTVLMPTLSPLRSPIRARAEMCLSSSALAREWHAARVSQR